MEFQQNVALGPLTTLGVGGPSRWFARARDEEELRTAIAWAGERALPLFVLGGGSNLVVSDSGWPGLTLHIAISGVERRREGALEVFEAGAGEEWDLLVAQTVSADCAGMECLSGIPGTVGGTPIQNVGAYGQDVSETILGVRALELSSGEFLEFTNSECGFSYRASRFNTVDRSRFIVTRVAFGLTRGGRPKIEYADLKKFFTNGQSPSLAETRKAILGIRHQKAMLIVDGDEDCRSAGSFFKNPVVDLATFNRISGEAGSRGLSVPHYPAGEGKVKVAAAWLVEKSGFTKGFTLGPVGISRRHALAIVNRGRAKASDVIALKETIQRGVRDSFGVELQPEPVFVGF